MLILYYNIIFTIGTIIYINNNINIYKKYPINGLKNFQIIHF